MTQTNEKRMKELKIQREFWRDTQNKDKFNEFLHQHVHATPSIRGDI